MVPQILPRSLDAQQNDAVDRSHPPRSTNITNRAGISTQDPLSAGIIKPPNHVGTAAGGLSSVSALCRFQVGFIVILLYIYTVIIVRHILCLTFTKPFSESLFRKLFSEGLFRKAFWKPLSKSLFEQPLRTSLQSPQVHHSDILNPKGSICRLNQSALNAAESNP